MANSLELKDLLEAGAHFGHQTHKWNPKMKPYVYGERNGVYVIDLEQTIPMAKKAYDFIKSTAASGKSVLFVGTKRQASSVVRDAADNCGAFHVTSRWLGGMLTNYKTIAQSIDKLRKVEKMKETGDFKLLTKKEQSKVEKEVSKLEKNLGSIVDMTRLPGALFVVDIKREHIAIKEAQKLNIPIFAMVDTNSDPREVDYVIPANDDASKSIDKILTHVTEAITTGLNERKAEKAEKEAAKADKKSAPKKAKATKDEEE